MDYNPPSLRFRLFHPHWVFDFFIDGNYYVHKCRWWFWEVYKINKEPVDKAYFMERVNAYKETRYYSYF